MDGWMDVRERERECLSILIRCQHLNMQVVLTNPAHKGSGMVIKAKELAAAHRWFYADQFTSEANAAIHERTTGAWHLTAWFT